MANAFFFFKTAAISDTRTPQLIGVFLYEPKFVSKNIVSRRNYCKSYTSELSLFLGLVQVSHHLKLTDTESIPDVTTLILK